MGYPICRMLYGKYVIIGYPISCTWDIIWDVPKFPWHTWSNKLTSFWTPHAWISYGISQAGCYCINKPLSSHFFRLLDCTFPRKGSTILPQPYVHLKQLASRPAVRPGICCCLTQVFSPHAKWNGGMCVARHVAWYERHLS